MNTNDLAPNSFLSAATATGQRKAEQGLCAGRAKTGGFLELSGQGLAKAGVHKLAKHKQAVFSINTVANQKIMDKSLVGGSALDQVQTEGRTQLANASPISINNLTPVNITHFLHSNSAAAE